jgi:hypothetical protein
MSDKEKDLPLGDLMATSGFKAAVGLPMPGLVSVKSLKQYVGIKLIFAEPEAKDGKPGYKVIYPDGYVSWSPVAAFEEAYVDVSAMSFGKAFELMRMGYSVARAAWKHQSVFDDVHIRCSPSEEDDNPYAITYHIRTNSGKERVSSWTAQRDDFCIDDWFVFASPKLPTPPST